MLATIAKRLFSILAVCATGAWSLFVVIVDAFDHANSAKAALLGAGMPEWLFPPWWGPITSLVVLTGFVIWLNWPTPAPATGVQGPALNSAMPSTSDLTGDAAKPRPRRYLEDFAVFGGNDRAPPRALARFATNGRAAAFYLEYSAAVLDQTGDWTAPRKVLLAEKERFVSGEIIALPITYKFSESGKLSWALGPAQANDIGSSRTDCLNFPAYIRGRVTLLTPDDTEEHCYFMLKTDQDPSKMPDVLGEHMFLHMLQWEGLEVRNRYPHRLFSH